MDDNTTRRVKYSALVSAALLLVFYFIIMLYVLINVVKISFCENFICGISFQVIGFVLLTAVVVSALVGKAIKIGFMIPTVISTVVYTLLLDGLNIAGILFIPGTLFFLLHMILLFGYLLIVMPMIIIGKR